MSRLTVDCKEQNARKVMFWAAVVDGRVFVHWFASGLSVTGPAYLRLLSAHCSRKDSGLMCLAGFKDKAAGFSRTALK